MFQAASPSALAGKYRARLTLASEIWRAFRASPVSVATPAVSSNQAELTSVGSWSVELANLAPCAMADPVGATVIWLPGDIRILFTSVQMI